MKGVGGEGVVMKRAEGSESVVGKNGEGWKVCGVGKEPQTKRLTNLHPCL